MPKGQEQGLGVQTALGPSVACLKSLCLSFLVGAVRITTVLNRIGCGEGETEGPW